MSAASPACPYKVMPQFLPEWPGEGFWLEARDAEKPLFAIAAKLFPGQLSHYFSACPGALIFPEQFVWDTHGLGDSFLNLFNGGQWISPDARGRGFSPLACKLLHAITLLQFDIDHIFALVVPKMHGGGDTIKPDSLSWRQGFRECMPGITWDGYYPERQELSLIWMTREQAEASLTS